MSDKRQQLSILDQWANSSGRVSRSTERHNEIDGYPLNAVGRRIDKTGPGAATQTCPMDDLRALPAAAVSAQRPADFSSLC